MLQNSYHEHFKGFLDHVSIAQINVLDILDLWFFFRQPFWQSSFFISVFLPAFQYVLKHGPSTVSETKTKNLHPLWKLWNRPSLVLSPLLCPLANIRPAFSKNRQLFFQVSGGALIAAIVNYNNHMRQRVHLMLLLLEVFLKELCHTIKWVAIKAYTSLKEVKRCQLKEYTEQSPSRSFQLLYRV